MRKVRELLQLHFVKGMSARQGAKMVGIGKTAASEYISGFKTSGLDMRDIDKIGDNELLQAINTRKESTNERYQELASLFPYFEKELTRTGVTLQLLWEEYKQVRGTYYEYSQFCHHYYRWRKDQKVSMHIEHKAGDKMYVDFAGSKLAVTNPETGEITEKEVYVSVLGSSQLAYIEAVHSQKIADWASANENALRFYKGVPAAIVPDCLKSAVIKADKYEPEINQSFNDFASHYGTVILPARALHPKDKALAENFVRNAYQQIYAPIRNQVFFSIEELNNALWDGLDKFNRKNFQGRDYSRFSLYTEVEQQHLKPLRADGYQLKKFARAKVQYNHHIYLKDDAHYYSVPFQLTGKEVHVSYTCNEVEIYFNNQRVALHKRSHIKFGYTTNDSHRPQNHQYMLDWTPERFLNWASKISPDTYSLIERVLHTKEHPEQAYKSCMGILQLTKKYPQEDFIKSCRKALDLNCIQFKFIKNTLQNKTFNMTEQEELQLFTVGEHENLRGKGSFN
jgi:transposase